jgi:TatD DNase family protein
VFVDAHAHVDRYGGDLRRALAEIADHRILTISNSMDLPSYRRNAEIARGCDLVLPSFGVHPWNAPKYADRLDELGASIDQSPLLGEIGLDYHFVQDESRYEAQRKVLEFFLGAARDQDKIVTLHTKGAEDEIVRLLDQYEIRRAIIHWYSGPMGVLRELVARGCYFTVGVELLRADHIRAIARELPADRILTETDNPGGHQWLAGEPGMPSLLNDVVEALAQVRGLTPEAVGNLAWANFVELVEEDPWLAAFRSLPSEQGEHRGSATSLTGYYPPLR